MKEGSSVAAAGSFLSRVQVRQTAYILSNTFENAEELDPALPTPLTLLNISHTAQQSVLCQLNGKCFQALRKVLHHVVYEDPFVKGSTQEFIKVLQPGFLSRPMIDPFPFMVMPLYCIRGHCIFGDCYFVASTQAPRRGLLWTVQDWSCSQRAFLLFSIDWMCSAGKEAQEA